MTVRQPLVIGPAGLPQQLQPGDTLPLATAGAFGVVKPDGTTITVAGGVFSAVGGGGGGSTVAVATIAALIALSIPADGTVAIVSDPLRGGEFIFSAADHSGTGDSAVLHDPGATISGYIGGGITVAPASALTGVSGAWIRQYQGPVRMSWWGVKSDGIVTDPYGQSAVQSVITGIANNAGKIRFQVVSTAGMTSGDNITIYGIDVITPGTNFTSTVIAGTNIDTAVTFGGPYVLSGAIAIDVSTAGPHIISGTDNTQTICNWHVWAIYRSAAGFGIHVIVDSGTILWASGTGTNNIVNAPRFLGQNGLFSDLNPGPQSHDYIWRQGMKDLTIECDNGQCQFQNTLNLANGAYASLPVPGTPINFGDATAGFATDLGTGLPKAYKINTTVPGSQTFTLVTPADSANFSVGEWFMLGALDMQFSGGTNPNLQYYEFNQVVNIQGGTITVANPIQFQYRSDYPDFSNFPGPAGQARMWKMTAYWDCKHIYKNIGGNSMVGYRNNSGVPNSNYIYLVGLSLETYNWKGAGFVEGASRTIVHYKGDLRLNGEIDKLVESSTYINCTSLTWPINVQSASPKRLTFIGGEYGGLIGLGQMTVASGTKFDSVQLNCQYGYSAGAVFNGCEIRSFGTGGNLFDGALSISLTQAGVSYSNGRITVNEATFGFSMSPTWSWVPGQTVCLQGSNTYGFNVSAYSGVGIVRAITESGGNMLIDTDLPFATLPSGAMTGVIFQFRVGQVLFNNCFGCPQAEMFSRACAKGLAYHEYNEWLFSNPQSPSAMPTPGGELVSVEVDVVKPATGTFTCQLLTADARSSTLPIDGIGTGLQIGINHGFVGKRFITQSGFIGPPGTTDAITVSGAAASAIPPGRVINSITVSAPSFGANWQSATYIVKLITDCGILRKGASLRTDNSGNPLIVIAGPIP